METSKKNSKEINYSFNSPLLLVHEKLNKGSAIVGNFTGSQSIIFKDNGDVEVTDFSANLTLPSYLFREDKETEIYFNSSNLSATLIKVDKSEFYKLEELNKARFNKETGIVEGIIGLKLEMPGEDSFTNINLPFTCLQSKRNSLIFGSQGLILNGLYAGGIIACCGIKTPAPPPCIITISTTTISTKGLTGGVITFTGLVQTAVSSVGHTFTPGPLPIGTVRYWRGGRSTARVGIAGVTIAANGVITYPPTFGVACPIGMLPVQRGDVVEFVVNVSDVPAHTGSQTFAHAHW